MDIFLKATGAVLIAVILCIMLAKYGKDYAILLSLAVCALVFMAAGSFLYPIFSFFSRLVQLGGLDSDLLNLLLKISGIIHRQNICAKHQKNKLIIDFIEFSLYCI